MQPKFTFKNVLTHLQKKVLLFLFFIPVFANSQVVISTASGTDYNGALSINNPAPLNVSFVVQNTNAFPIILSSVSCQMAPFGAISAAGDASTSRLLVSSTSLSGNFDISTAAWTQIATGSAVVPAAVTITPVITGLSYSIPANTQLRFVLELTKGLRVSGPFAGFNLPTPNVFNTAGVNLKVGNNQIGGQNIGFAGVSPAPAAGNNPIFFGGSITFSNGAACTGTPNPGATATTPSSVCAGQSFLLTLPNLVPTTGLTFQWQSSTSAAGTFTNIGGATGVTHTATDRTLFYRCNVTCGANSGASTPIQPAFTTPIFCYCAAGATSTAFEKISNVSYNFINNNSTSTAGYENFRSISTVAYRGVTSPISVTLSGAFSTDQVFVWIDFNQNGSFSDPGELVYTSPQGVGPHVANITIPATASLGATGMRVRMHDASFGANSTPCGNSDYGQVEDYSLDIQNCTPISFSSQPASASIQCSQNASFAVVATGSVPLVYQWQYRVNASSPWVNINAATDPIYSGFNTATLSLTNVAQSYSGYQYRALVSNPCSGPDFSTTATLTVSPLQPIINPLTATICAGSVQQLSITNIPSPSVASFTSGAINIPVPDRVDCGGATAAVANAGVNHTIPVNLPLGSVISNMKVRMSVNTTWMGDLIAVLKAPNGQVFNLLYHRSNTGGTAAGAGAISNATLSSTGVNFISTGTAPYSTGEYRADAAFTATPGATPDLSGGPTGFVPTVSAFNGLYSVPSGNWTLALCDPDGWGGDCGSLTNWSLEFTYGAPYAGVWTGSNMFLDAATLVPYTGSPATASSIFVKPTATTNYTVSFNTSAPSSCASAVGNVTVNVVNPVTVATQPSNAVVCHGANTSFTAAITGGPAAYQWQLSTDNGLSWANISNGGVYSGATTPTLSITGATNASPNMNGYRYRLSMTAAPCAGTVTTNGAATLTVNALPSVSLTATDLALTPGNPTGQFSTITASAIPAGTSYTWQYNGAALTSGTPAAPVTGATYTTGIDGLGTYTVRATTAAGCTSTAALAGSITIGAEASDRLWIYPNPNNGIFQVRLYYPTNMPNTPSELRTVSIYNAVGELVATKDFGLYNTTSPYQRMDFDLSGLAAGTYAVKVIDKFTGKIKSGLFVKQ